MLRATGVIRRRHSKGTAMKKHRLDLVKDSLGLLRQARAGFANDSTHGLAVSKMDEALEKLELLLSEGADDRERLLEILRVIGQGFAAIPGIERAIEMLRDR
jgi:hypothetical protein